eukprot:scaffold57739_cov78-Phaeocystis_antarctica.AAC.4
MPSLRWEKGWTAFSCTASAHRWKDRAQAGSILEADGQHAMDRLVEGEFAPPDPDACLRCPFRIEVPEHFRGPQVVDVVCYSSDTRVGALAQPAHDALLWQWLGWLQVPVTLAR